MASISIPDEVKDRLDQLAASQEQPTDVLVARSMAECREREGALEAEVVQALHEDGRQTWAAFERDGLHLTGEEMRIWLASWGTRGETPLPKCHT